MRNFIVTIDGKTYSVGVEEVASTQGVSAPAATQPSQTATPQPVVQKVVPAATPKATPNGEKVLSPFPGLVKNTLVNEGATVKKDQPILVLEAMKMDNEITAPCDGVVSFTITKGSNVETDAVLAVIS